MRNLLVVGGVVIAVCLATGPAYADCQGGPVFGETIFAVDANTLAWATPGDIDFVKGDLSALGTYTTWVRGSRTAADRLDISLDNPAPGKGLYYIIKPSGPPCGSWQSSPGAEPNRDILIDPPCSLVTPTHAQIESAVSSALQGLESPWTDPQDANLAYARIQDALGCAVEEAPQAAGASRAPSPAILDECDTTYCNVINYCGVSNSANLISLVWPATQCLNQACFQHDTCSRDICVHPLCSFSDQSDPECDPALLAACSACAGAGVAHVTDDIVCTIAQALAAILDPPFCYDPPCSQFGQQCNPAAGSCCYTAEGLRPLSLWPGEGDATDAVGTNHGTLMNGVAFRSGHIGQAFSFDGIDDYVEVPDAPPLNLTSAVTIEGWFQPTITATVQKRRLADNSGYSLVVRSTGVQGTVHNRFDHNVSRAIPGDRFTHVAWTYDRFGGGSKIYIDGMLVSTLARTDAIAVNDLPLQIGRTVSYCCGTQYHAGVVDELALHDRALSQGQIQVIVASGHAGTCP